MLAFPINKANCGFGSLLEKNFELYIALLDEKSVGRAISATIGRINIVSDIVFIGRAGSLCHSSSHHQKQN